MQRAVAIGVKIAVAMLIAMALAGQVVVLPLLADEFAREAPESQSLRVPALIAGIAGIALGQAILVILWRLVSLVEAGRIFSEDAFRWVRAMVTCAAVLTGLIVLVLAALVALAWAPPGLVIVLLGLAVLGVAFTLTLVTMLALLRQATAFADELAEVV